MKDAISTEKNPTKVEEQLILQKSLQKELR